MEKFLKIVQAGWILAMCASLIHVYFDLVPTDEWYWQIFVLMAFGVLFTLWITLVVKILKPKDVNTNHDSKVLNIPRVSGSAWDLPDGVYQVGVDKAAKGSKDHNCRVWMKKGLNNEMIIVAEEHYR